MVTGVCGGLAQYTGLDPVIFRVVFVVATLLGGGGLAAYIVASIAIPADDEDESHAQSWWRRREGAGRVVLIGVALFAVFVLSNVIDNAFDGPDHQWGGGFGLIVLLGIGLWLWTRHRDLSAPSTPSQTSVAAPSSVAAPTTAPATVELTAPAPRRKKEPSRLFGLTFSVVLLAAGVLAAVQLSNAAEVSAGVAFAVLLIVVGCGLLAGTWFGRSRGLIAVGLVLTVMTAVASVADVPVSGGAGERFWRPLSADELEREYRLGAGRLELDLREVELDGRARRVEVSLGTGRLRVLLPPDVDVDLDTHVGMGSADVLGREDGGIDLDRHVDLRRQGDGRLVLHIELGLGRLEIV